ncbi:hypothetical protein TNCV_2680551 [Trichonephila clavipes]|uniref:Uncharacterized protein n=1 Tax=Trichonephila clavipes TaxID=2585209 RepID=A0A8X6VFS9_TRICX|nr:hypothetical protein TNCV_2680551 [Trichonephila clavipes]
MMAFGDGQVSGCGNRFYIDNGHVSIDCVRSSFMKTHWEAAIARLTTTFVNNPFGSMYDRLWQGWRTSGTRAIVGTSALKMLRLGLSGVTYTCPPKADFAKGP